MINSNTPFEIVTPAPARPAAQEVIRAVRIKPLPQPVILALHDFSKSRATKVMRALRRAAADLRQRPAAFEDGTYTSGSVTIEDHVSPDDHGKATANFWEALAEHMTSPETGFPENKPKDQVQEIAQGFALVSAYGILMRDYIAATLTQADDEEGPLNGFMTFPTYTSPTSIRVFKPNVQITGADQGKDFRRMSAEMTEHFRRLPMHRCLAYRVDVLCDQRAKAAVPPTYPGDEGEPATREKLHIKIHALEMQHDLIEPASAFEAMRTMAHKSLPGLSFELEPATLNPAAQDLLEDHDEDEEAEAPVLF